MWKQAQEGLRRPQKVVRRRRAGMEMRQGSAARETAVEPMVAEPVGRVPRISRLMALAIRMEGLVRTGRVKDYAELARLGGVSRARVSQVLNLRNLARNGCYFWRGRRERSMSGHCGAWRKV